MWSVSPCKEVLDKVQVLKDTYETSTAKKQALEVGADTRPLSSST